MLTAQQQETRETRVTASFLPNLMEGEETAIVREWMRIIGHPDYQPEDFTNNWPAHYGTLLETPALDWHERTTGEPLTRRGESVIHPILPHVSCTLDAWRERDRCVLDAKACGQWQTLEHIEKFYTPQIIVQMRCTQADNGALLIVHGGAEPAELPVHVDAEYEAALWQRVDWFWSHVETMTPPYPLPQVVPPDRWRTINLNIEEVRQSTNWAAEMIENILVWNLYEDHSKQFEAAKVRVKELLPPDVGLVTIQGFAVKRARNNAVTIRHAKVAA